MHIVRANLTNLTRLWKKYGAQEIKGSTLPLLYANTDWPHRCWLDPKMFLVDEIWQTLAGHEGDNTWLEEVPESMVLAVWPMVIVNGNKHAALFEPQIIEKQLQEKKWVCAFQQKAMYLELQEGAAYLPGARSGFQINPVRSSEELAKWVEIASDAFAYHMDSSVIEKLIDDQEIQMLIGSQNEQLIASALLYKTGNSIGVHQFGVKKAFQGKGFARRFMTDIIAICAVWQAKYIVLQASQAGEPLYESLGFKTQFLIKNYHNKKGEKR